jgi:hypothetical protein
MITLQFDSCLEGMGLLVTNDGSGGLQGGGRANFPFDLNKDSSHQNTCEFIALVLGVVAIARSGRSGVALRIIGDSTAALSWGCKESWKGHLCRRAAVIFLLLSVAFDMYVEKEEHIAGEVNIACDKMSRGVSPLEVGVPEGRVIDFEGHRISSRLLVMCDPTIPLETESDFISLWKEVQDCIKGIKDELVKLPELPRWADRGVSSPLAAAPFVPSPPSPISHL